jgi:branched-chain amino acid transport system permease protein
MVTVFLALAGIPLPIAAVLAIIITVLVGLALYAFAIDPARGSSAVTIIIITIGASIFLRGVAQVVFDKRFHALPHWFGADPIRIGGAAILPQSLVVLAGAALIVGLIFVLIDRTIIGKAILATAANRLAARLVGIDVRKIMALSFGLSAAIGALAGLMVTPITLTSYDVGTLLALKGFAGAMLGGMGSAIGAIIGGLLLGLAESFGAGLISSKYKDAIAFLIILAVLFVRPQGLFGKKSVERV